MRCDKVKEILSLYIDNQLDDGENKEIENHIKMCEECNREYEDLLFIKKLLSETPQAQLPEGFKADLHDKLVKCKELEKAELINSRQTDKDKFKTKRKINWRILSGIAAGIFIMVVSVSSILNNNFMMDKSAETEQAAPKEAMPFSISQHEAGSPAEEKMEESMEESKEYNMARGNSKDIKLTAENRSIAPMKEKQEDIKDLEDKKIIVNGHIHLETKEYALSYEKIVNITTDNKGFIQSSSTSYKEPVKKHSEKSLKTGNIIIRIPKDKFNSIFNEIITMDAIIDEKQNINDITDEYIKAVAEKENLNLEENKLKDEVNKKEDAEQISNVKRKLTKVLEAKDELSKEITRLNDITDLATIKIYIDEVD
ncbi:DUF4349 domain-containing protein [Maledivibacter halophilus]|uniref:Anti-sigma-W factor RsiW n=1 Tax=Maledivibacter halophilus TaxID=36842 RepID=A0A1T5KKH6_9FIRM|nr:DUF4349 domain-containing protein [Maledivibacter halophilus]SKC64227.1 Putative zinc-finger [Maledivibacter halophilus]